MSTAAEPRLCALEECRKPIPWGKSRLAKYCCTSCQKRDAAKSRRCAFCNDPMPKEKPTSAKFCSDHCRWADSNKRQAERDAMREERSREPYYRPGKPWNWAAPLCPFMAGKIALEGGRTPDMWGGF